MNRGTSADRPKFKPLEEGSAHSMADDGAREGRQRGAGHTAGTCQTQTLWLEKQGAWRVSVLPVGRRDILLIPVPPG